MYPRESNTARCVRSDPDLYGGHSQVIGPSNGTLPPNEDNQIKFWGQSIFQFPQGSPALSQPPTGAEYDQWEVPDTLKEDVAFANKATFGKRGVDWKIHTHRICW